MKFNTKIDIFVMLKSMMKYIYIILFSLFLGNNIFGQISNENLLLHYPFNGNANDESDNGFDGVSNAILVKDRNGYEESAYYFDGINSFITVPNESDLKPTFPFSISLWFRVEEFNGGTRVLFTNDEDLNGNVYSGFWLLYNSSGRISAGYGNAISQTVAGRVTKHANQSIIIDKWYHVAVSFNALNDIDLYIDCELDNGYYSGSASSMVYLNMPGAIGRDLGQHQPLSNHKGEIDDIRFYNTSFTQHDVINLCNEDVVASVLNFENENLIEIFPNPTKGVINIKLKNDLIENVNRVKVINSFGQIVLIKKVERSTIKMTLGRDISKGIYFIQMLNENSKIITTKKLILR